MHNDLSYDLGAPSAHTPSNHATIEGTAYVRVYTCQGHTVVLDAADDRAELVLQALGQLGGTPTATLVPYGAFHHLPRAMRAALAPYAAPARAPGLPVRQAPPAWVAAVLALACALGALPGLAHGGAVALGAMAGLGATWAGLGWAWAVATKAPAWRVGAWWAGREALWVAYYTAAALLAGLGWAPVVGAVAWLGLARHWGRR